MMITTKDANMTITTKDTKITKKENGFGYLRVRRALRGSKNLRVLDPELES